MVRNIYVQENKNDLVRDNVEDITENKALVTQNIADIEENKKAILMEQLNNSNLYLGALTYGNSGDDVFTDAYNVGTLRKVGSELLLNEPSFTGNYSVKKWFNQVLNLTGYYTWKIGEGITNKVNAVPFSKFLSIATGSAQDTLSYIYDDTNGVIRNTYEPGKYKNSVEYQPAYYSKPQRNKLNPYQFDVGDNKTWTISENGNIKTVTISGLSGHEFIAGETVILQSFVNAIGRNGNNVGGFPRTFNEDGTYNFYNVSSDPSLNPQDFTQTRYSVYNLPDMTYDPPQLNPSIMRARYVLKAVTNDSVTFDLDPETEAADVTKEIEPYTTPTGTYTINFSETDGIMYLERLKQYQTVVPNGVNYAPLSYDVEVLEHDIFVGVDNNGKTYYYDFLVQRISKTLVDSASTLKKPYMLHNPIQITRDRTIEWPSEGGFMSNINALPEGFTAPSEWNNPDYYTWFAVTGNPQFGQPQNYTQEQLPRVLGLGDIFTPAMQKALNMTPISEYYLPTINSVNAEVQENKATLAVHEGLVTQNIADIVENKELLGILLQALNDNSYLEKIGDKFFQAPIGEQIMFYYRIQTTPEGVTYYNSLNGGEHILTAYSKYINRVCSEQQPPINVTTTFITEADANYEIVYADTIEDWRRFFVINVPHAIALFQNSPEAIPHGSVSLATLGLTYVVDATVISGPNAELPVSLETWIRTSSSIPFNDIPPVLTGNGVQYYVQPIWGAILWPSALDQATGNHLFLGVPYDPNNPAHAYNHNDPGQRTVVASIFETLNQVVMVENNTIMLGGKMNPWKFEERFKVNNESIYALSNLLTGVILTFFNISYGNSGDQVLTDGYMINQFYKDNGELLIKQPSYYGAYFYKQWFNQVLDLSAYYTWSHTPNVSLNVNVMRYSDYQELITKTPQHLMSYIQNNTLLNRNKFPNGEFQMKFEYSDNFYSLPREQIDITKTDEENNLFNIGNNKTWIISENNGIKTVTIEISGHTLATGDHVAISSFAGPNKTNTNDRIGIPRIFNQNTGEYTYITVTNNPDFNPEDFSPTNYAVFNLPDMTFNPPQLNPSIKRGIYIVTVNGDNVSFNLDPEAEAADPAKGIEPYTTPVGSYEINLPPEKGSIYLHKLFQYQTHDPNGENYASLNHNIDIVEQTTFTTIDDNKKVLLTDFIICRILKSAVDNVATLKSPQYLGPLSGDHSAWPDAGSLMTSLPGNFDSEKWSHWNKDDPDYYTWFIKFIRPTNNYNKYVMANQYTAGDKWNLDALGTPSNRINHYALNTLFSPTRSDVKLQPRNSVILNNKIFMTPAFELLFKGIFTPKIISIDLTSGIETLHDIQYVGNAIETDGTFLYVLSEQGISKYSFESSNNSLVHQETKSINLETPSHNLIHAMGMLNGTEPVVAQWTKDESLDMQTVVFHKWEIDSNTVTQSANWLLPTTFIPDGDGSFINFFDGSNNLYWSPGGPLFKIEDFMAGGSFGENNLFIGTMGPRDIGLPFTYNEQNVMAMVTRTNWPICNPTLEPDGGTCGTISYTGLKLLDLNTRKVATIDIETMVKNVLPESIYNNLSKALGLSPQFPTNNPVIWVSFDEETKDIIVSLTGGLFVKLKLDDAIVSSFETVQMIN